jgi:hypothetical protein
VIEFVFDYHRASTELQRGFNGTVTPSGERSPYSQMVMRRAFVLQLGSETQPSEGRFAGRIEEVDTGLEHRFRSATELLDFLGRCFERPERDPARRQPSQSPETRETSQGESS